MDRLESLKILKQLAEGIDPYTGEILPDRSPYQKPQTVRALFQAIIALEGMKETTQKAASSPANAGKSWELAEDDQLKEEFESGMSVRQLAQKHQRTVGAIESRLIKLGKLTDSRHPHSITSDQNK